MKFVFLFENVLKQKKRIEDEKAKEFSAAQIEYDQSVEVLDKMYLDVDEARNNASNLLLEGKGTKEGLDVIEEFIVGQKIRILNQQEDIRNKLNDLDKKRENLKTASIDKKIMEKLKENQFMDFKKKKKKKEDKENNDRAVMRFIKREL